MRKYSAGKLAQFGSKLAPAIAFLLASPVSAVEVSSSLVFVTSVNGSANLGTWADADAETTGLEAADSICRNRAEAAMLPNPENFVAWLSDSNDDAYCRVHGLSGTRDANCGQGTLPAMAGPWSRTDGEPFGGSIERLLSPHYEVYLPLDRDEFGNQIPDGGFAWTATVDDGGLMGETCEDWTAETTDLARVGVFDRTSASWQNFGSRRCDQTANDARLYCIEARQGPALDLPPAPSGRLAFVTSVTGSADFGSWQDADPDTAAIEAADSICNNRADAAGLPFSGQYKAWLSTTEVSARSRLVSNGPWFRRDGFTVAENVNDLTDGTIGAPINQDELGNYQTNAPVWTGTSSDGTGDGFDCGSWETLESSAREGRANTATAFWTSQSTLSCSSTFGRLYCFSDPPPEQIFEDGFETPAPVD